MFAFMLVASSLFADQTVEVDCSKKPPASKPPLRSEVYKDVAFKAGEKTVYEVSYMGALAGHATLEVRSPVKYNDIWQRSFHAEARTGDWFRGIYVAEDVSESISQTNFAVSKFFLEQNEGKLFSSPIELKKWLEFNHNTCKVNEKIQKKGKPEELKEYPLAPGAMDALSVVFYLRNLKYKIGQKERGLVYTSEKNWWLDAEPLLKEKIKVPGGEYNTTKIKLQTYVGKELQQKGDVHIWIGTESPFPLVQINAEIKIGSIKMELKEFTAGR